MDSHGNNPTQNQNRHSDQNKNDAENTSRIKKLQQRTTSIALSILVAVSFGVIGFEVLATQKKTQTPSAHANGSKALTIIAHERESELAGLTTNLNDTWDSQRSNSDTVREINRLQARKIKELKRQLNEANQKAHDVKTHLFTKGDPADRARLAEVCQELVEKERYNEDYQKKIAELEAERDFRSQKITRMEQTIDALATMTDTQRETKEKAIFNFQSQIERLEEDAKREKQELQLALGELEEANVDLQDSLAQKLSTIKTLEDEISWQYGLLQEKDQDMQSQSKLYTRSEDHMQDELNGLSEALEMEMLKNQNLLTEIEVVQAKEQAQEQYTRALESKLERSQNLSAKDQEHWQEELLALSKEYMELQGVLDVYAHSHDHLTTKQAKLSALVREGKVRMEMLGDELDAALAMADAEQQRGLCVEEEFHAAAHKVLQMEDEIKQKQAVIESKQQEIDTITYSNASLRDQLHARIDQLSSLLEDSQKEVRRKEASVRDLTINLELERTRIQELDHNLKDALTRNVEESDTIRSLQEQLHQKSERATAMEERLKDKREEIEDLQDKMVALQSEYDQEKRRSNELHTALSNSLNESESVYDNYSRLQDTVEENTDMLSLLQDRIESKKNIIDDLQSKLDEVTTRLNFEQKRTREMEIALEDSKSQSQAEKILAKSFKDENEEVTDALNSMKRQLVQKEERIDQLRYQVEAQESQVEALIAQLEEERDHSNNLEDQVYETKMTKGFKESEMTNMESTIGKQTDTIKDLREKMTKLSQKVELEQHRTMAYEKANAKEVQYAKEMETKLEEFASRIVELQNVVQDQHKQITDLRGSEANENMHRRESGKEMAYNAEASTKPFIHEVAITAPVETAEVAEANFKHTVKDGENLGIISTYYYGTPNRWIDIYNANRKQIPDKNRLEAGITIVIPQ